MSGRTVSLDAMRRVDGAVGRPLCRALTIWRRLADRRPATDPVERIIVLKLAEQGATVVALPALQRAVELVGRDRVWIAVFASNRPILDELDVVDPSHVLTVRTGGAVRLVVDLLRLVARSRRLGIDATADLEGFSRATAVLAYLSGAHRRAGLHAFSGEGADRGDLLTHRLSANPVQHVAHTFRAVVESLDQPADRLPALDVGPWPLTPPPLMTVTERDQARVAQLVQERLGPNRGPEPRRLVLLNPNAGDLVPLRRWPEERYVAVGRAVLAERDDAAVLVTGAPDERAAAEAAAAAIDSPRCASVAGATTLRDLLVLYHQAEVLVTNDSGPVHYAALAPIDVVALYGPESPAIFGPTSPRATALWAAIPCSPCVHAFNDRRSPCQDNVCMQRITVEAVTQEVLAALARRATA